VQRQPRRFEGRCDSLKGYTFDCPNGRPSDQYNITMKKIAEYVEREYTYGGDIRWTVKNEKRFTVPKPEDSDETSASSATEQRIWERCTEEYIKRDDILTENCETVYSLVMGQCTESMTAKLEGLEEYNSIQSNVDVIKLIKAIKGITYQYNTMTVFLATKQFYLLYQGRKCTHVQYLRKFQTCVSIVEQYGGSIGQDMGLVKAELEAMGVTSTDFAAVSAAQKLEATQVAKDKYLAMAFLSGADERRCGKLLLDLQNDYTKGVNNYPVSVTSAFNLLVHYKNNY
jgi:hypothetical protein